MRGLKSVLFLALMLTVTIGMAMATGTGEGGGAKVRASMATDVGGLGDGSFNDGSYGGLQKAEAEGLADINVIESKQQTDYIPNLSGLADDGADVVFAVGFMMSDAMIEAAENYPDTDFAGVDIYVDPSTAPSNALGIQFKENEAGYLAGIVAGYMTLQYADRSDRLNDQNVVGLVLGMDIPPCERYEVGFTAGVHSVNPDCEVLTANAGSFTDQAKGKELTLAMVDQGADIVFQIAGLTGLGVISGAQEAGICAIGVDVDQAHFAPDTVITSAMKELTQATYQIIQMVSNGTFEGGQNYFLGIAEDGVGIAPYHDFEDVVPNSVQRAVEQAKKDIASGKIIVPATRADL